MIGTDNNAPLSFIQKNTRERRQMIDRLKDKINSSRTPLERIADYIAKSFGSVPFLAVNFLFFVGWIVINLGLISGITPIDPFPFGLLTMVVSLEAILLTIFVLISQTRSERSENLRENIDLFFEIYTEAEITKLVELNKLIAEKNGINLSSDMELKEIQKPINMEEIESMFEERILQNNKR